MERRLAAILAVDMVGYSRLMGEDEAGTLAAYRRHRHEFFERRAAQYNGKIVKFTGDGALIEFSSVVESVRFAVEVQLMLKQENERQDGERQYHYRIGINVGDIIPEEGDIYGSGVNMAARLESLAEPGGICLSAAAHEHVRDKIKLTFEHIGERLLKNIAEAVSVYRVVMDEHAYALATPIEKARAVRVRSRLRLGAAAALILAFVAGALWWTLNLPIPELGGGTRLTDIAPDKPSIAVLPFVNVGGEDKDDHLADGLTDDLITELSKVSGLFVIARHSAFAQRGQTGKVQTVAEELGVHYVLEGSLRKAQSRLRINVQLIDAETGLSLWAERYDREYSDLFAVQDDVTGKIISALSIKLSEGEQSRIARIPTEDLEAYDYYLRAEHEGFYFRDVATFRRALDYYRKAIALDPGFADAHAGIARIAVDIWRNDYNFLWTNAVARKIAYDAAGEALQLDPDNARAHTVLALLQLGDGREAEANASAERAVALQPNNPEMLGNLALVEVHTGKRGQAVATMDRALKLEPATPPQMLVMAGIVYYTARNYERAVALLQAAADAMPTTEPAREYLAAAHAHRGAQQMAEAQAAELLHLFPAANLNYYAALYDYWRKEDLDHHLSGLYRAGIGEWPFDFVGNTADRLGAEELVPLVSDTTWTGQHKNGTAFVQFFDGQGNTAYRTANTTVTGKAEVDDDKLCITFGGYMRGRKLCGLVFRNAKGADHEAHYIYASPDALKFFSVARP